MGGTTTAVLLLSIGMANIFAWVLTAEQIPQKIAAVLLGLTRGPYLILLLINVVLIIVVMWGQRAFRVRVTPANH